MFIKRTLLFKLIEFPIYVMETCNYLMEGKYKGKMKKRIKEKHKHHEEVIRQQIEEEIFQGKNVFFENKLKEATEKYVNRINYLVGANNEAFDILRKCEAELEQINKAMDGCVSIPNATADVIVLEENF